MRGTMAYTRRQFLAQTTVAGLVGWHRLHAQAPQAVPIPGVDVGEAIKSFALRNVTVIDCTGKPAQPGMTVVTAGNRIESIEPPASARIGADVQTVDANGKFLIPGLWDMHVHRWPDDSGAVSPLYIANGVTGIRTMGVSRFDSQQFLNFREEVKAGKRLGPRMVVASQSFMDGTVPLQPEQGRIGVREARQDGVDFIKVHDTLSKESYFSIADEAVKLGMPLVGHVPNVELTLDVTRPCRFFDPPVSELTRIRRTLMPSV